MKPSAAGRRPTQSLHGCYLRASFAARTMLEQGNQPSAAAAAAVESCAAQVPSTHSAQRDTHARASRNNGGVLRTCAYLWRSESSSEPLTRCLLCRETSVSEGKLTLGRSWTTEDMHSILFCRLDETSSIYLPDCSSYLCLYSHELTSFRFITFFHLHQFLRRRVRPADQPLPMNDLLLNGDLQRSPVLNNQSFSVVLNCSDIQNDCNSRNFRHSSVC